LKECLGSRLGLSLLSEREKKENDAQMDDDQQTFLRQPDSPESINTTTSSSMDSISSSSTTNEGGRRRKSLSPTKSPSKTNDKSAGYVIRLGMHLEPGVILRAVNYTPLPPRSTEQRRKQKKTTGKRPGSVTADRPKRARQSLGSPVRRASRTIPTPVTPPSDIQETPLDITE
jgi:hypothetical protein